MQRSSDGRSPLPPQAPQPRRAPTIRDVANAAGVAVGTASKALNGRGKLRAETRERVRAEAERLGFRPNDLVHSLLRGRTFTVGLLTTDSYGRFSIPLMKGVEDALGPARVSVFLCDARDDQERERRYIDTLLAKQVDGIIVTGRRIDPRPAIDVGQARVPVLYAYTQVADPNAVCILPDDAQGGYLATAHLLATGRRHLAHVTGPAYFEAVRLRLDGMRRALADEGLKLAEHNVLSGPWRESWGYRAIGLLLDADPRIDGLFCGSDQIARGALDALRERGVRVPDDVAVVGFDNWEVIANETRPPLTTVELPLAEVGRMAGQRLLAMIEGTTEPGVVRLPCRLVVRDSCGPLTRTVENMVERRDEVSGA